MLSFAVDGKVVDDVFTQVAAQYGENGRFYHNLHHIEAVLDHIQPFLSGVQNKMALQLAAWFHDVVYDAKRHDNEKKSAEYARNVFVKLGFAEADVQEVERLILLTEGHETAVSDVDGQILLDADLAILAAEPAAYDGYAQAIRQEYAHVPDAVYQVGRTQVLTRLQERPFLYYLPEHQSWEAKARENMQRELTWFMA